MIVSDLTTEFCEKTGADAVTAFDYYLKPAADIVWNRLYPFSNESCVPYSCFPNRYGHNVMEIAIYIYDKEGAEGETAHTENGIGRTYESGSIPESILRRITPHFRLI